MIDQVILSNLQPWCRWYSHVSDGETDEIDEKVLKTNATTVTATAEATPDVLNSSVFFSTIDRVILSNLQPWCRWYNHVSDGKIDEIDEKVLEINATTATATAAATPDVLNLSVFLSTMNQVILSNLQLQWRWYSNVSNGETDEIDEKVVETQV